MPAQTEVVRRETFAPILYVSKYRDFATALHLLQDVPQGLSSSILTNNLREAEVFRRSSAPIVGLRMSTWTRVAPRSAGRSAARRRPEAAGVRVRQLKAYMRRQTQTVNYGSTLPLAQGVAFDL